MTVARRGVPEGQALARRLIEAADILIENFRPGALEGWGLDLDELIEARTQTLTVDALEALMLEHSAPAGRIYRGPEMLSDPHFAAREAIVEAPHPRWQGLKMQNVFPKLSATPGSIRSIAPQSVGQDNDEVPTGLLELPEAELEALSQRGVI